MQADMTKTKDPRLALERKNQIMTVTCKLLTEKSYHQITLEQVAQKSRISKGLVIYYFKNKEKLLAETFHFILIMRQHAMLSLVEGTLSPTESLRKLVNFLFSDRTEIERLFRLVLEIWAFSKHNPKLRVSIIDSYRHYKETCKAMMRNVLKIQQPHDDDMDWFVLNAYALFDGLMIEIAMDPTVDVAALRDRYTAFIKSILPLHSGR